MVEPAIDERVQEATPAKITRSALVFVKCGQDILLVCQANGNGARWDGIRGPIQEGESCFTAFLRIWEERSGAPGTPWGTFERVAGLHYAYPATGRQEDVDVIIAHVAEQIRFDGAWMSIQDVLAMQSAFKGGYFRWLPLVLKGITLELRVCADPESLEHLAEPLIRIENLGPRQTFTPPA